MRVVRASHSRVRVVVSCDLDVLTQDGVAVW